MKKLELIIILKLKSFHSFYLNKYLSLLWKKFKKEIPNLEHQIFLPKQIERFTVLRSPHVDKKARDQFERRVYSRILYWKIPFSGDLRQVSLLFLKIFQSFSSLVIGIEFKVSYILTRSNTRVVKQQEYTQTYKKKWKLYQDWILQKKVHAYKK
jgi:small subunit ribosomal protein S10